MHLDDVIPAPRKSPPKDVGLPNLIPFQDAGPHYARIVVFAGPFFERNVSTTSTPFFRPCKQTDAGAKPRIRVHCELDKLKNKNGDPLVLTKKYLASRQPTADFTQLLAGLARLTVDEVGTTNLNLNDFVGRRVEAILHADRDGFAKIQSLSSISSGLVSAGM